MSVLMMSIPVSYTHLDVYKRQTHSFIRTGQIDSKFGFALETGEAMTAVKLAVETDSIDLC